MKLITRDTDYAVRAICYITEHNPDIVPASELVRHLHIPSPFLRKIMQELKKNNILNSSKGKGGGFSLKISPDRIYLIDLIEIFQGPFKLKDRPYRGLCNKTTERYKYFIIAQGAL